MAKTYNQKIGRNTDWGGDASTGGLPVNGARVQEFIKDELNSKFGSILLDTGTSKYLCFANDDTKRQYEITADESLVLGQFDAISNYSVAVFDTTKEKSVLVSKKNNTLSFKFKVVNNNTQIPTGEAVRVEYSFNNGGKILTFTEDVLPHDLDEEDYTPVSFIIDDYISVGTNNITIKLTGKNTYAVGQIGIVYEVLDLTYVPSFNYNMSWESTEGTISVAYTIECARTKYIEWYIDGVKARADTVITDISGGDTIGFDVRNLAPGAHTFQTRAYVLTASETKFYGENNFYMFAIAGGQNPCVLIHDVIENGEIVGPGETLKLSAAQFEIISFDWAYYDPRNRSLGITFSYNGKQIGTVVKSNGDDIETFTYRPVENGNGNLLITILDEDGNVVYEYGIGVEVEESSTALSEASTGLILKLNAMGRSNDEVDKTTSNPDGTRNVWTYTAENGTTYNTTFNGFAWNSLQGWNNNALVMSDGAYIEVDIRPMMNDWALNGGTIEIDIETFDVDDDNAVVATCSDGMEDSAYVMISATQAKMKVNGTSAPLETRFRDNDRMDLCFIGNAQGNLEDSNLLYIVNNGVLERAVNFNNGDQMASMSTLKIGDINGEGKVKCRLHSIKVYNRALSVDEAFANYIVNNDDVQKKYEENNILKEGSTTEVDYNKIVQKIPVLIFTGNVPAINAGATKDVTYYFDVEYTNMQDPTRNFTAFHVQTKLQGTSSLGYPRKNYKIKTKNNKQGQPEFDATNMIFDPITRRLYKKDDPTTEVNYERDLTVCWTFDYLGACKKNGNIKVKSAETQKVNEWTLKADYMESSMSHNTGAAKMWNNIFKNVKLTGTNTYIESANEWLRGGGIKQIVEEKLKERSQNDYPCRTQAQKVADVYDTGEVRTAVDGFPMVMFYRLTHDSDLVFMGQYNFNNDKSSEELYGFEDIYLEDENGNDTDRVFDASEVECWEGLSNTNPIGLFKDNSKFYQEWSVTYESRYPDQDDGTYTLENLKALNDWVISTRHEEDTVIDDTRMITIDARFAKKINRFQYLYDIDNPDNPSFFYLPDNADTVSVPDTPENRQLKFQVEKWEHFDMWKVAGYYIFLMRYGAVDQFVKNTMLTTEGIGKFGGSFKKWYFINYDNDCLFGLRNNGVLAFGYDLDRNTVDPDWDPSQFEDDYTPTVVYAMMGHDSTLWNNLEKDDEFMRMVRDLDDAMHSIAGGAPLTYEGFCQIFDKEQTDCWPERIYNANERYKYIFPFKGIGDAAGQSTNNLWMLQGTRKAHRHWWLSNRLEYYDAKWISGDYKNSFLEMKANVDTGTKFTIIAGAKFYYAWGNNKRLIESNVELNAGDTYDFVSPTPQVQGDPIRIYAITKVRELDLTEYMAGITQLIFTGIVNETTNELRKLVIGTERRNNTALLNIDSIGLMPNIQYLDITNCQGIKAMDVSVLPKLSVYKAKGTTLQAFAPANGSKFDLIELPSTIQTLTLDNVSLNLANLLYTPTASLRNLKLKNNATITKAYYTKLVAPWLNTLKNAANKSVLYGYASMDISNINWTINDIDELYLFEEFSHNASSMKLSGRIDFTGYGNLTREEMNRLRSIFGENCFNKSNALYIVCPTSIFIETSKNEMVAGQSNLFTCTIYPSRPDNSNITYEISEGSRFGTRITTVMDGNLEAGLLESYENIMGQDSELTITVVLDPQGDLIRRSSTQFTVLDPTYATTAKINGTTSIYTYENEYEYHLSPLTRDGKAPIGTYEVEWTLSGGTGLQYINVAASGPDEDDQLIYKIRLTDDDIEPEISDTLYLTARIESFDGSIVETTSRLLVLNKEVIMTDESNPVAMERCHSYGFAQQETAMMKSEAAAVRVLGNAFRDINEEFPFEELRYFTGLTTLDECAFQNSKITDVILPETVTNIGIYAFENCTELTAVTLNQSISVIPEGCFVNCRKLADIELTENITLIDKFAFGNTAIKNILLSTSEPRLSSLIVYEGLTKIEGLSFDIDEWNINSNHNHLEYIEIPASVTNIGLEIMRGGNIREFHVEEDNGYFSSHDGILFNNAVTLLYKYPAQKEGDIYDGSAVSDSDITKNPENLANYAFYGVKYLKKFVARNRLSRIGVWGFANSNIEVVDFVGADYIGDDSVGTKILASLPNHCFFGCSNLVDVIFNTEEMSIRSIDDNCFMRCNSLVALNIPEGVKDMGTAAITECSGLTEINFPESLTGVTQGMISSCQSLEELVMPKYSSTNVRSAVINCNNLTAVTLPIFSYTKENGYDAFDRDGNLIEGSPFERYEEAQIAAADGGSTAIHYENVILNTNMYASYIPDSRYIDCNNIMEYRLSELDNQQFANIYDGCVYFGNELHRFANGKETVEFKEGVTGISTYAAYRSNLRSVTLPDTIVNIGSSSFHSCRNLQTFVGSDSLTTVAGSAFYVNGELSSVRLGKNTSNIDEMVFYACYRAKDLIILSDTAPTATSSSFGYYRNGEYVGEIGSYTKSEGNTLWISYGATGYDNEVYTNRLLAETGCGYTLKYYPVSGTYIYVKFIVGGSEIGDELVKAISDSGEFNQDSVYENGYHKFYLSSNSHPYYNEPVRFFLNGNQIGQIKVNDKKTTYTIEDNVVMGLRKFGLSNTSDDTVSMDDYNKLNAKVNQMSMILNDLLKK